MTMRFALSLIILISSLLASPSPGADRTAQTNPPNLVIIMADDAGRECFGCYGSQEYQTPNIDRLAANGLRFANCHSCPLCTPSRVKLMTGQSNIRNYYAFSILPRKEKTFAHMLQQAGYLTAVAGKWQLLGAEHYGELAGAGTTPDAAGFDEHCLWQVDQLGPRYWHPKLVRNGNYQKSQADQYGPDICTEFICQFIDENRRNRFCVYYPMILPHSPFRPTPHSADKTNENKKQNFVDMVQYVDTLVGRIIGQLEKSGVRDNTLVMFLADNGTHRNIRSRLGDRSVQGGKGLTIDDGTHVPLVISWPAMIRHGHVCHDLIDLSDFLPTLADVTGSKLPADVTLDGISFAPVLRGAANPRPRQFIYCYYNPRPGSQRYPRPVIFARDKQFKLYSDGRLFDVAADILEQNAIMQEGDTRQTAAARQRLLDVITTMPKTSASIRQAAVRDKN